MSETPNTSRRNLSLPEFAALTAAMISMVALSIDIMLPVIEEIAVEMGERGANAAQLIIISLFVGLAIGQLLYGPVSDTVGRKPAIGVGFGIFIVGTIICILAKDFDGMLFGRFLQGLGAAAPRIVSMSIVRDLYEGREMAKITSIIMGFFILVPALAPAIGQLIVNVAPWRTIFYVLLAQGVLVLIWFSVRQDETLRPEYKQKFSLRQIGARTWEFMTTRVSLWYTMAAGIVFGAFAGYLVTSPQLFKDLYGIDEKFPYYFGSLALVIGSASLFNAKLVERLGMRKLCLMAMVTQMIVSAIFFVIAWQQGGHLPLGIFMIWGVIAFFMMGFLFGNFNAIALEPLGHMAGIGAAMVGSISTFLSLGLARFIGGIYDQTLFAAPWQLYGLGSDLYYGYEMGRSPRIMPIHFCAFTYMRPYAHSCI